MLKVLIMMVMSVLNCQTMATETLQDDLKLRQSHYQKLSAALKTLSDTDLAKLSKYS